MDTFPRQACSSQHLLPDVTMAGPACSSPREHFRSFQIKPMVLFATKPSASTMLPLGYGRGYAVGAGVAKGSWAQGSGPSVVSQGTLPLGGGVWGLLWRLLLGPGLCG